MQQQQHFLHFSDYPEQFLTRARQQQLIPRSQVPRIIKYEDAHGQHPSDSHGHSRCSSTSSLEVDEISYPPPQEMNMPEVEHPRDREPPASMQHIIPSISTSVVGVIESVILRDLIQLTMATGRIFVLQSQSILFRLRLCCSSHSSSFRKAQLTPTSTTATKPTFFHHSFKGRSR
jgi:hypothetical protein